jgi:hypothetical protein
MQSIPSQQEKRDASHEGEARRKQGSKEWDGEKGKKQKQKLQLN